MTPNGVPFPRDEQPSHGPQPPLLAQASYLTHTAPARRRRGGLLMASIGALVMLLLIGLVAVILGLGKDPDPGAPSAPASVEPGWDLAAETALATRPMPQLPDEAARPHALSTRTPSAIITLPAPGGRNDLLAVDFPPTPEGAIAQLAELTRVGLQGADPQAYELAYNSIAAPGSPQVESTVMHHALTDIRRGAGLPMEGAANNLSMTFTPLAALVKGTTDGGRYAVVCVLGAADVMANGTPISGGGGDCQAMRWSGRTWQIAPGAQAAAATVAWPGTDEALNAGYLPLRAS